MVKAIADIIAGRINTMTGDNKQVHAIGAALVRRILHRLFVGRPPQLPAIGPNRYRWRHLILEALRDTVFRSPTRWPHTKRRHDHVTPYRNALSSTLPLRVMKVTLPIYLHGGDRGVHRESAIRMAAETRTWKRIVYETMHAKKPAESKMASAQPEQVVTHNSACKTSLTWR